ncbi:hypothetical protein F5Y08DRAFT_313050 [Xylaria arbuscula]|nr:hypothetical protein F5Y08DRAFT_313050 [Xylaria arbuscula]
MANLPSQHPNLALHLTDSALTPLITSARAQSHLETLTALSHTALDAYESAQRFGLGVPQRIMVEHGDDGPVLLQSFLSPRQPTTTTSTNNTNTTNNPPQQQEQPPQHQGALALAVENRAPATATAYTTSTAEPYLRGGAGASSSSSSSSSHSHPHSHSDEQQQALLEEQLSNYSLNPADNNHNPNLLDEDSTTDAEDPDAPPLLLGIVVAPSPHEALEARRAAARLERVGREIQGRWFEVQGRSPGPPRQGQRPPGQSG